MNLPRSLVLSAVLLVSATLFGWGYWPTGREERVLSIPSTVGESIADGVEWTVVLELPTWTRAGDSQVIQLTVRQGRAQRPVDPPRSETMIAESRLELPGLAIIPSEITSEPIRAGGYATFYWTVRAREAGRFLGTAWIHSRSGGTAGHPEVRRPIAALPLDLRVRSFLGLTGGAARTLGLLGALAALVSGLPILVSRRPASGPT